MLDLRSRPRLVSAVRILGDIFLPVSVVAVAAFSIFDFFLSFFFLKNISLGAD